MDTNLERLRRDGPSPELLRALARSGELDSIFVSPCYDSAHQEEGTECEACGGSKELYLPALEVAASAGSALAAGALGQEPVTAESLEYVSGVEAWEQRLRSAGRHVCLRVAIAINRAVLAEGGDLPPLAADVLDAAEEFALDTSRANYLRWWEVDRWQDERPRWLLSYSCWQNGSLYWEITTAARILGAERLLEAVRAELEPWAFGLADPVRVRVLPRIGPL